MLKKTNFIPVSKRTKKKNDNKYGFKNGIYYGFLQKEEKTE